MGRKDQRIVKAFGKVALAALVMGCPIIVGPSAGVVMAHDDAGPYAGMKQGVIGMNTGKALKIDKDEYEFATMVEVTDQYRRKIAISDLAPGEPIFYRLNEKKQINKIVLLIPS